MGEMHLTNSAYPWFAQAEKHLQIRQDAERRYMAMLERACKMLADQILGAGITSDDVDGYQEKETKAPLNGGHTPLIVSFPSQSANNLGIPGPVEVPLNLHQQRTDCSTDSCLTSHESPVGLPPEGSSAAGRRSILTNGSFVWGETDVYAPDLHQVSVGPHGIAGCGV